MDRCVDGFWVSKSSGRPSFGLSYDIFVDVEDEVYSACGWYSGLSIVVSACQAHGAFRVLGSTCYSAID